MKQTFSVCASAVVHRLQALTRRNILSILAFIATIIFLGLLREVLTGEVLALDANAYQLVVVYMRREWLTPIIQTKSP